MVKFFLLFFFLLMEITIPVAAHARDTEKPIVMVMTSHREMLGTGQRTGVWFEEMSTPYYYFTDRGYDVTLASIKGGMPPFDPRSQDRSVESVKRFLDDSEAMEALRRTVPLVRLEADDYAGIFMPGGHGTVWDFAGNSTLSGLVRDFLDQEKPVAALCHAPVILLDLFDENNKPYIAGKNVTAFTQSEETAVGLEQVVPSYLDQQLRMQQAEFERADDFEPHAVRDGLLVTGQNPASSKMTAALFVDALRPDDDFNSANEARSSAPQP